MKTCIFALLHLVLISPASLKSQVTPDTRPLLLVQSADAEFIAAVRAEWKALQSQIKFLRPQQADNAAAWNNYLAKTARDLESFDVKTVSVPAVGKIAARAGALPIILKSIERYEQELAAARLENQALKAQLAQLNLAAQAPPKRPAAAPAIKRNVRVAGAGGKFSIKTISGDGSIIVLDDGSVWGVDGGDQIDSALWLPMSDVIVVDDEKMINVDDKEVVEVHRIR